jgi:DNA-binding HxlR family transcriptional regulator
VVRTVHPTVPPSVEYALTDMGRDLLVPLDHLIQWVTVHHDAVRAARARFDSPPEHADEA